MQTDPWVILGIRLGLTKPPGTAVEHVWTAVEQVRAQDAAEDGG